ncbi:MAG: SDR family NAD(P)-dependent oxidoreductase [Thermoguttaceae bacterium]
MSNDLGNGRPVAVVTGASSGLGAEFARQLAAKGYDLFLTARRESLLDDLAHELRTLRGAAVRVYPCDLSQDAACRELEREVAALNNFELLVNNAGFGRHGEFFPDVEIDSQEAMIRVHCIALMRLSEAALLAMRPHGRGRIINVASVASWLFGPGCVMYNSTKAFVLSFSRSLDCDVQPHGIRVQALCPGLTHTGFHDSATMHGFKHAGIPKWMWLSCERVVRESLAAVEAKRFRVVCVPSLRYRVVLFFLRNRITEGIVARFYAWRSRRAMK